QQPATGPALIVRVRPLDNLQADVKHLFKLVGQEEAGKQVDGLLQVYTQGSGVDTKKAWGAYGYIGQQGFDSIVTFLIPINDEKAFLKKLDGFNLTVKNNQGLYSIVGVVNQQDAFLRFANNYAYISNDKNTVSDAAKLVAPPTLFDPKAPAAVALILRVGQIPKSIRDGLLDGMKQGLNALKDQKAPDETEAQSKFKMALVNRMSEDVKNFLADA